MYTIDSMIAHLQELRQIAPDGGKTPIAVHETDSESYLEPAAIALQEAKVITVSAKNGDVVNWLISRDESQNTCQVVKVF